MRMTNQYRAPFLKWGKISLMATPLKHESVALDTCKKIGETLYQEYFHLPTPTETEVKNRFFNLHISIKTWHLKWN